MADVSLTIGSTTKLFDLAIEEGRKLFSTQEEPIIPAKASSDVPSYGDLTPEKILAFMQNNWRGGMGQKNRFNVVDMYDDGQNIDTREPNQIILGPLITSTTGIAVAIIAADFFENREYVASTRYVYKLNAGSTAWVEVLDVGAGDTIECLNHYDGYIYAGLTTGGYYYSDTGENAAWTQSTLSNAVMHEVCVAPPFSGTKDILVLATRPNILRTSISPLNGGTAWLDPPYYIGDENSDITSMFILNGMLFIGKEDGLYVLPPDGRPVPLLSYREQREPTNFAHFTNWQGIQYVNAAGDMLEIIGSSSSLFSIDYMGPLQHSPELNTIGIVKSITSDDKNIYALLSIGSSYIIYAGRERRDSVYGLRWEWTPYISLGTNACSTIRVMQRDNTNPKLWFGYGNAMSYVILSRSPNLPLGDWNYRFTTQGYLITSYFDKGYDTWSKILYQLWTLTQNLATGITIVVYYEKDTETSWNSLATITANGVQSVDLASINCNRIRLKIELNSDDSTKTPILELFIYLGVLQPEMTKTLDFTIVLGQSDLRKPSTDLSFLEGGRSATAPITLKDLRFGTTKYITFLPNSPMEIEGVDEVSKQPSYRARILAQQLNWTPP